ncbi:MAG: hypothetical protein ACPL0F_04765 [bacterium]
MGKSLVLTLTIISTLGAEQTLIPERLSIDGLIWCTALFSRGGAKGWFTNQFEFQHRQATVALTGKITPNACTRLEFDFSRMNLRDLTVEFTWANGLGLKLGQLKLPLSFNSEINEKQLALEEYPILYYTAILKPSDIRDIGILGWFRAGTPTEPDFWLVGGLVNGTGPNRGDDNSAKDLFARVVIKPWPGISLGGRLYYGWMQPAAVPWLGAGLETKLQFGPLIIVPEFALRRYQNVTLPAGDIRIETALTPLAPAVSLEAIRWEDGKIQWRVLPALNIPVHERLKILIGYQYHSRVKVWEYQSLVIRLLADL